MALLAATFTKIKTFLRFSVDEEKRFRRSDVKWILLKR